MLTPAGYLMVREAAIGDLVQISISPDSVVALSKVAEMRNLTRHAVLVKCAGEFPLFMEVISRFVSTGQADGNETWFYLPRQQAKQVVTKWCEGLHVTKEVAHSYIERQPLSLLAASFRVFLDL